MINETYNLISGLLMQSTPQPITSITFDLQNQWMDEAFGMSIVGMLVVFVALIILAVIIFNISKVLAYMQKKRLKTQGVVETETKDIAVSGEINAAIAMALSLYFGEIHDDEAVVLTIKRAPRPYSPWSSKIFSLRDIYNNYRI
ncbi:MAG: OadG family protein [Desulfobulbaceae bacterium]|nr:OadG family protein [Candidatus Kapabacteria bacterium]MBS4001675.1 OadG family protein [Desulfobulbaceae bacterium]